MAPMLRPSTPGPGAYGSNSSRRSNWGEARLLKLVDRDPQRLGKEMSNVNFEMGTGSLILPTIFWVGIEAKKKTFLCGMIGRSVAG